MDHRIYHRGLKETNLVHKTTNLVLPEIVDGNLELYSLISVDGITWSKKINGNLRLDNLTSIDGLVLPERIEGDIVLRNTISVKEVTWPKDFKKQICISNLLPDTDFPDYLYFNLHKIF